MAIVRVVKDKNFITMGKYHLKEKDMSLKAIGLLSIMLSLPDDWDYSIKGLVKIRKESYDAIRTTLKELEQFGYLKRTQILDKGKFVDVEYTIYEKPILENPITEKPITENQTQYNTNIIEEINNKKEIYKERFKKPTLEEIEEYCKERNNNVDAKRFYDYYDTNDWKDKDNKQVKNWKQKMIANWENKATKQKEEEIPLPKWFNQEYKEREWNEDEQRELQSLIRGNQR